MGRWKRGMGGETLIPSCLVTSFLSITVEIRFGFYFQSTGRCNSWILKEILCLLSKLSPELSGFPGHESLPSRISLTK